MTVSTIYLIAIFCFVTAANAHDDENNYALQYNVETFQQEIPKKNHFVMFYAPWCGHCQKLGPTWEQLAEMLNDADSNICIAKVDCTVDSKICSEHDITGYPTLKFFHLGNLNGVKFKGTRDLPSLTVFINEQLRSTEKEQDDVINKVSESVIQGLKELTDEDFNMYTEKGKHFIKFYAPWCGHCQKLAPIWEHLAQSLQHSSEVSIAKVDCTQYRSICNQFDIKGYPTILWIENGKKIEKYQGVRSQEDLKQYVNKMLGSDRADVKEAKHDFGSGAASVVILNGDNFKQGIESGITFVKFFAPWCGHCKRLAPTWEDLAKKFLGNPDVKIVKVDCTLDVNKELCNNEEVDGFPSVFLYRNGKKVSEYDGNRSLEDLEEFVLKYSNSHDEL